MHASCALGKKGRGREPAGACSVHCGSATRNPHPRAREECARCCGLWAARASETFPALARAHFINNMWFTW